MNERRRLERFDLKVPAAIEFVAPSQEKSPLKLLTTNVCSGGMYLDTVEPLPEGTHVRVELVLPLDRLKKLKNEHKRAYVRVTGRVLRSESQGMAIGFDGDYQITGSIN